MTQANENRQKHVYLIGNDNGYRGYTYNRNDLKGFLKTRKGYTSVKVKTDKVYQHLMITDEIIETYPGVFLLGNEEEYFIESFQYYLTDMIRHLHGTTDRISVLKFSDEEKPYIDTLNEFIINIIKLAEREDYTDYTDCNDEEFTLDSIIKYPEAQKYFIKNTLDAIL